MVSPDSRQILLLGSGFVARPCAEFILRRPENHLTIASRKAENAAALADKLAPVGAGRVASCSFDVMDDAQMEALISKHDLVISLIPYIHHHRVMEAAIKHKKHVVTTSYVNPKMQALDEKAKAAGITCMNEIGVDPGIDHLYAVKKIDEVHKAGGQILEFVSYCGGLPAPECSNNPLGYKFSWSSRGVLLALRNTAKIVEGGKHVETPGPELMNSAKPIHTGYKGFTFVGYPNRDSTPYSTRYHIPEATTVIRGSLRYHGFPAFIQTLVNIGFLDETEVEYLKADGQPLTWRQVMCKLLGLAESSSNDELMAEIKRKGQVETFSAQDQDNILMGIKWLGLVSDVQAELRGTILDTLCGALEKKMMYGPGERDMVFLQHRFEVRTAEGKDQTHYSTLIEFGQPNGVMAMAKTVGIPCGIAVQLILDGKLNERGVLAPMSMDICQPFIDAVEKEGIGMEEIIIE